MLKIVLLIMFNEVNGLLVYNIPFFNNPYTIFQNILRRIKIWILVLPTPKIIGSNSSNTEVVTLLSHKDLLSYICMMKTFNYYCHKKVNTCILDDGTLSGIDYQIIKYFFPRTRVISKSLSDNKVNRLFRAYTDLLKFRRLCIYMKKKIDPFVFATKNKILLLDSDILFFKKPRTLISWIEEDKNKSVLFMNDIYECYLLSNKEMYSIFHTKKNIRRLNSGIIGINKDNLNLNVLNKYVKYILDHPDILQKELFIQQIFAFQLSLLAKYKKIRLSKNYLISNSDQIDPATICRHYVRFTRHLFNKHAIIALKNIRSHIKYER